MELETPPDVIFVSALMPDYSAIIRDLRSAGIEAPLMGGDSMDTADFYTALGSELGHDIYISTHSFISPEAGPAMEQFIADFTAQKYGNPPEVSFNAMGYDTIQIIADSIERAGTTDGEALAQAMVNHEFDLLSGKLTWSDAIRPYSAEGSIHRRGRRREADLCADTGAVLDARPLAISFGTPGQPGVPSCVRDIVSLEAGTA
ncbi:MAG: ABC transporter substrate-binding protein [Thermomicrobiales bacterium]